MDGKIYRVSNGYRIVFRYTDSNTGEKKQTTKRGFKLKSHAKKYLNELHNRMIKGTFNVPNDILISEFLRKWLEMKEGSIRENTYNGYRVNIENHIIPNIGDIELQKVIAMDIQNLYKTLKNKKVGNGKEGLSAKSILYIHRVLVQAFDYAINENIIYDNVAKRVKPPKVNKYEAKIYDKEQILKLLDTSKDTLLEVPIALAALAGLRRGEVLGLRWKDIDFDNSRLYVKGQVVYNKGKLNYSFTKTDESHRCIYIAETLMKILKTKKDTIGELELRRRDKNGLSLVCCYNDGSFINPSSFSKKFAKFLKDNGFAHIRFHDLRHSFSSIMHSTGVSIITISKMLGHTNPQITSEIYTHLLEEDHKRAANKLNSIFSERKAKEA